jgi:hypothetical protein
MPNSSEPPSAIVDSKVARLKQLRHLSFWLDEAIAIPGTRYRIGLDPIIGLIPGGGDTVGMVFSSFIVLEAARLGASRSMLGRMAFNVLLETLLGTVPLVGDFFDATWKSNSKNIQLLEAHLQVPQTAQTQNRGFAILLVLGLLLVFAGCVFLSVVVLRWLIHAVRHHS